MVGKIVPTQAAVGVDRNVGKMDLDGDVHRGDLLGETRPIVGQPMLIS